MNEDLKKIRICLKSSNIAIVSKAANLNTNTLYKITRGRDDISVATIKKLKSYFDLD